MVFAAEKVSHEAARTRDMQLACLRPCNQLKKRAKVGVSKRREEKVLKSVLRLHTALLSRAIAIALPIRDTNPVQSIPIQSDPCKSVRPCLSKRRAQSNIMFLVQLIAQVKQAKQTKQKRQALANSAIQCSANANATQSPCS